MKLDGIQTGILWVVAHVGLLVWGLASPIAVLSLRLLKLGWFLFRGLSVQWQWCVLRPPQKDMGVCDDNNR